MSLVLTPFVHRVNIWPVTTQHTQNEGKSDRILRRRALQRTAILRVASSMFAQHGASAVRLDEIAQAADVSRGTLYSHFASKDELIQAIITPALEAAVAGLKNLTKGSARKRMDELISLYLRLWDEHRDALRLSYRLQDVSLGPTAPLHNAFRHGVMQLLTYACRGRVLRIKDPAIASRMIMRVTVPLLEVCVHGRDGNELFIRSMRGLLMVDPKPIKTIKTIKKKGGVNDSAATKAKKRAPS